MQSFSLKKYKLDAIALLAGLSLPFAFAPFYYSFIGFIAPGLLLYTWLSASPRQAFRKGFLFGLGCFALGVSWIYVSIHFFGQAPVPLAIFITATFILYLALFTAVQGYCITKYVPENTLLKILFVFPCSWMLFEILRSWLFTGFPWLLLGYSQSNTWLKGYAPVFGIYGVSFLSAFIGGVLVAICKDKTLKIRFTCFIAVALLFVGGFLFNKINWTEIHGKTLQVTLIQGNVEQESKWRPEQILKSLQLYTNYTKKNWTSDIIIWPEAAVTLPLNQAQDFLAYLGKEAKENHAAIITGIPVIEPNAAFNSMIAIGNGSGIYHKRHLVPFGEYTPLKPIWKRVTDALQIPMSNFLPGEKSQQSLYVGSIAIAPYICYEIAYPLEFLSFLPQAELLLTITDDSWFGHSVAPSQHLQMAEFRALETGRYLLFSSNTGITAVFNAKGELIKTLPTFKEAILTTSVQPMVGNTPWMIWKMLPLYVLIFVMVMVILRKRIKFFGSPDEPQRKFGEIRG